MTIFQPDPTQNFGDFFRLLEARKKAAEQRKREELDRLTIYLDGKGVDPAAMALHRAAMTGDLRGKWKLLGQTEAEQKEAERKARREGMEINPAPDRIWSARGLRMMNFYRNGKPAYSSKNFRDDENGRWQWQNMQER
jgi:hypothetical protein